MSQMAEMLIPQASRNAYALGARQRGAEIMRFTPVMATEAQADGSWIVKTPKGDIHTQWVVNAAGLWGREVAAMAGVTLPLQPTEHQYFVTESIAEIEASIVACLRSLIATANIICAKRGRACWSVPMRKT